jgi:predicted nucleic acid-binding protein
VAENIGELLSVKSNVLKEEIFYRWHLINTDLDDNKFVDLAVAADADFIVSNDTHFQILKEIPFPKVKIIHIQEFLELVKQM